MKENIYVLTAGKLPDDIKKRFGVSDLAIYRAGYDDFWAVGEDPSAFRGWFDMYLHGAGYSLRDALTGHAIMFMSDAIYSAVDGNWTSLKDRKWFGTNRPFSSLEEARLLSVVNGWPEPMRIALG